MLLGIGVIYFLVTINLRSPGLQSGEWPRNPLYVYTTSKVTVTFDGEEVLVEGTTRCKRRDVVKPEGGLRWWHLPLNYVGSSYICDPKWFARSLDDGSVLFVGAYDRLSPWPEGRRYRNSGRPDISRFKGEIWAAEISRIPPAVVWIDNAEAPTRAEYYYGPEALRDPVSRLSALSINIEMTAASALTNESAELSPPDTSERSKWFDAVPENSWFVSYYAIEIPKQRWSTVPALREALAGFSEPTVFYISELLPEEDRDEPRKIFRDSKRWLPPSQLSTHVNPIKMTRPKDGSTPEVQARLTNPGFVVHPLTAEQGIYRFAKTMVRDVLHIERREMAPHRGVGEVQTRSASVSDQNRDLWNNSMLFDPESDTLYQLRNFDLFLDQLR